MRLPEYDRLDATALAALVAAREVSAADLVEAALLRIEARNPQLNAVVDVWADSARRAAAKPLPPGPLSGVPFLLKDVRAAVAGQLLSEGSRLLAGIRSDRDVEIVRRFRAAGMVAVGRTNAPEFALLPTTEPARWGPCRNPWDRTRSSGGSSGGSAAAVAARMVPLGHGGDGGGSIRVPSSSCGVFGLKPTRGRVSLEPEREVWSGLSAEHVITRSVRDSARVLDLLAGPAPGDPAAPPPPSRPWSEAVLARPARLRVAFTSVPLLGGEVHPECRAAVEGAAKILAGVGHDVEEARPDLDAGALARAMVVVATRGVANDVAAASRRAGRRPGPEDLELQTRGADVLGRALGDEDLATALAAGARARATMDAFHVRYDVLLTPTTPRPPAPLGDLSPGLGERAGLHALIAFPIRPMVRFAVDHFADGPLRVVANTVPFNFTGQPAASVPLHWSADGLPVGVQVVGRYGDEATVLATSAQLEAARPWADRAPPGI